MPVAQAQQKFASHKTTRAAPLEDIVYSGDYEHNLRSISPDGKRRRMLGYQLEFENPCWSPNGTMLAAEVRNEVVGKIPPSRLALLDRSGRIIRYLRHSQDCIRPVWSPDGKFIYALDREAKSGINRWSVPEGEYTEVSVMQRSKDAIVMLSFSPSGKQVALLWDFHALQIASVIKASFQVQKAVGKELDSLAGSVWLDEGHLLLLARKKEGDYQELWNVDVGTGKATVIPTPGIALRDFLVLSPDRRTVLICATSTEHTQWNLWLVPVTGGKARRLTTGEEELEPSWRNPRIQLPPSRGEGK